MPSALSALMRASRPVSLVSPALGCASAAGDTCRHINVCASALRGGCCGSPPPLCLMCVRSSWHPFDQGHQRSPVMKMMRFSTSVLLAFMQASQPVSCTPPASMPAWKLVPLVAITSCLICGAHTGKRHLLAFIS